MSINNSARTNDAGITNDETNDLFGLELLYDKTNTALANTADWRGMISAVKWSAVTPADPNPIEKGFLYTYDYVGRLGNAGYVQKQASSFVLKNTYTEALTYDENGNIATLQRYNLIGTVSTLVDNLTYTYKNTSKDNQLDNVTDAVATNSTGYGWRNYTGSTAAYTYDDNGNLLTDSKKGTTISYNEQNKPVLVMANPTKKIEYKYDAAGARMTKIVTNGAVVKTVQYVGGYVIENNNLAYYGMAEGRVRNDGGASLNLKMEYFITDHQGNTRVSFEDNGSGVAVTRQETSYYAFGMPIPAGYSPGTAANKKLYNAGSEWQDDIEALADYYSTFYREYDPILGRFNGVDPMSESFESWSTYHYSYNNPVNFNDPMGDYAAAATTARGKYFEQLLAELARDGINSSNAKYYPGEGSDGGGSPYVNDPFNEAISKLHGRWGVTNSSFGGQPGFNNIVDRVKVQYGSKTDTESDEFYNLTAEETVREQVFNKNYEEAYNTIINAYDDIFVKPGSYTLKPYFEDYPAHVTSMPMHSDKKIAVTFGIGFFEKFASGKNSFGLLVRSIYHEYIHVWDYTGTNNHRLILYPNKALSEFRGHYLMGQVTGLPNMTSKEKAQYWGVTLNYVDSYGTKWGDLFNYIKNDSRIPQAERNMYTAWHLQMIQYVKK